MEYQIQRGDQKFGPYSLAELQQYVQEGRVLLTLEIFQFQLPHRFSLRLRRTSFLFRPISTGVSCLQ